MLKFPDNFFWGAATSSYQVEGSNRLSDWWQWEEEGKLKYKSGLACRHYELYKEDFDLAKSLSHNAHRLSIEWSRIEPREGEFSSKEIAHYVDVVTALKERGIEPVITLHHFTNPAWFTDKGGWLHKKAPEYFLRYTEKIVEALCNKVRFWVTINEPMVYSYHAYVIGIWPPMKKSISNLEKIGNVFVKSHILAYRSIHNIYRKNNLKPPYVSVSKNMQCFEPIDCSFKNILAVKLRNKIFNFAVIEKMIREKTLDFIGLNYYTRQVADVKSFNRYRLLTDICMKKTSDIKKNYLGWDVYPEGLYRLFLKLKKYNLPIFILENGICTTQDNERWEFIREHLKFIHKAISSGVKVIGYLYWSLLDNFEWHEGFSPRFGLIEVDYNTYKRTVRESAKKYSHVCKTGELAP
ncbi:MAG: glycoside hydrolase family 1 protein [Candidatus Omnitrophica bacterium]|nr:glycoside hydrolase family 1 protein [Candidatus Omnitrophota bacterium]